MGHKQCSLPSELWQAVLAIQSRSRDLAMWLQLGGTCGAVTVWKSRKLQLPRCGSSCQTGQGLPNQTRPVTVFAVTRQVPSFLLVWALYRVRIVLLRHGQSEGNVDQLLYTSKGDARLELTKKGIRQVGSGAGGTTELFVETAY